MSTDTPFHKALRWRVHDVHEAIDIADTHRCQADLARSKIQVSARDFCSQNLVMELQDRARKHDQMAQACEQHATKLITSRVFNSNLQINTIATAQANATVSTMRVEAVPTS